MIQLHSKLIIKLFANNLCKKLLVFTSSDESANLLSKYLEQMKIKSYVITSTSVKKLKERLRMEEEMEKSREPAVLISVNIYKEGTDLPFIDSVFYSSCPSGQTNIMQSMTRCLRLYPDKTVAKIIIPMITTDSYQDSMFQGSYDLLSKTIYLFSNEDPNFYINNIKSLKTSTKIVKLFSGNYNIKDNELSEKDETMVTLDQELIDNLDWKIYDKKGYQTLNKTWETAVYLKILDVLEKDDTFEIKNVKKSAHEMMKWLNKKKEPPLKIQFLVVSQKISKKKM